MRFRTPQLWPVAQSLALTLVSATAAAAAAADITVTDARVAGGKLVITGTTAPKTWVRLDGQTDAGFNVKSGPDGAFAFRIVYHPGDCIVDLQSFTSPATLGAATSALVADCGPAGVSPRGPWNAAADYVANDLVTYQGSTWRARRGSSHATPVAGALWELFAAGALAASAAADNPDAVPTVAPTGAAGGDLTGTYPNPKLGTKVVKGANMADDSVSNRALRDDSVGSAEIADGAVTNADIANDAINSASILNESITSSDLATNSVNATEIADNSIDSGEIVDNSLLASDLAIGSVGTSEIQDGAVGTADIANNAVTGAKVANNSLTTADIAGADVNGGGITVPTGYVPNGRCRQLDANVGGATAGEAVVFSTKAALQDGIIIYGQRVPSNGHVTFNVCNFSGATQAAISNLPVRLITFN